MLNHAECQLSVYILKRYGDTANGWYYRLWETVLLEGGRVGAKSGSKYT